MKRKRRAWLIRVEGRPFSGSVICRPGGPFWRLLACCLAAGVLQAAADEAAEGARLPESAQARLAALREGIDAADRFDAEGLVADRRSREVILFARATGLPANSPAEFVLVGPQSVHDYEALAVTFAMPSDIARAIEFIGVPRGEPAFTRPMSFWPRGERLLGSYRLFDPRDGEEHPLETLMWDRREGVTFSVRGMIYAGSRWVDGHCAADDESPGSVLSTYNEPNTLLDFPRQAGQSEVYERFVPNPDRLPPEGALLKIRFVPEPRPDSRPRVERYRLLAALGTQAPPEAEGLAAIGLALVPRDEEKDPEYLEPAAAFSLLRDRVAAGFDPYVTPVIADDLTLGQARAFSAALEQFEGPNGLRVEAPSDGQLYYRAFIPREDWRVRDERAAQPWELLVSRSEAQAGPVWRLTLTQIVEHWRDDHFRPDLEAVAHPLETPGQLAERLAELGPGLPVILVFAPHDAPLEAFMPALRLVHETHPTVHVFTGNPLETRPGEPSKKVNET